MGPRTRNLGRERENSRIAVSRFSLSRPRIESDFSFSSRSTKVSFSKFSRNFENLDREIIEKISRILENHTENYDKPPWLVTFSECLDWFGWLGLVERVAIPVMDNSIGYTCISLPKSSSVKHRYCTVFAVLRRDGTVQAAVLFTVGTVVCVCLL